ncbi:MAG TPA: hypothetical protein VN840_16985 [Streptosporangiaceae bacterium]|nr:hypothetical protein [Streptosporangiaceae bacterium]
MSRAPDFDDYRAAVAELAAEVRRGAAPDGRSAEAILARRLDSGPFAAVLSATPQGRDETAATLLTEVRSYQASSGGSASGAARLVRIAMLAQIDTVWWGGLPEYQTDADVLDSADLADLDELRLAGELRFSYRNQPATLLTRAARSAERHTWPGRVPRTAGLWLARGRPQVVAWLDQLAAEFAKIAPPDTPPLWVNSLARSVAHQRHLKSLGYLALLPSSHCVGYAADIEMTWYRRFRAHRLLRGLLLDRQRAGQVNVIDEGQAWHVCLCPQRLDASWLVPGPRPGS